jgi:hypothetical protein
MFTKIMTIEAIKSLIGEVFFNKQSHTTKISDQSSVNAIFYGLASVTQKAMKDIALVESHIFPQSANGTKLDTAGQLFSSISRYSASGSSTYLLLVASSGTVYPQATTTFSGKNGVDFELDVDFIMGTSGFGYAKVRSVDTGKVTNVDANTITSVSPEPAGHIAVTNEFKAGGGRDIESDEDFRNRIKSHRNIRAQKTLAYLAEVFRAVNEDVLFLQNIGFGADGKLNVAVVQQNGADLTSNELASLLDSVEGYFALTDLNKIGDNLGIELVNPTWYEVGGSTGVDFRVQLLENYDPDQARKNIQVAMSRYFDIRKWTINNSIEWDDLLEITKKADGVKYVPDGHFNPNVDETVPDNELPRIKKFVMRDMDGNIISDIDGVLTPIFYPNN